MAVRVILFLTLFTGMCVAQSEVKDIISCPCSCAPKKFALGATAVQSSTNETLKALVEVAENLALGATAVQSSTNETLKAAVRFADDPTSTYTCVPRNLALGAPAVQSSTQSVLKTDAKSAVDGNRNSILDSRSCSQTDEEMSPWWRVDLGDIYTVTRVSITNRGDCCAQRINGAQIRIGNSLKNNGNSNALAELVVSIPLGETQTFQFKPVEGRYVNIVIPGRNEYLTLCEVEVFAD